MRGGFDRLDKIPKPDIAHVVIKFAFGLGVIQCRRIEPAALISGGLIRAPSSADEPGAGASGLPSLHSLHGTWSGYLLDELRLVWTFCAFGYAAT